MGARKDIKNFVIVNQKTFKIGASEIVSNNKEFVKECIEKFNAPDVYKEMEAGTKLTYTKFFTWWSNRVKFARSFEKVGGNVIKKTTKQVVKKKIDKQKETETKDCVIIEKQTINQNIEVSKVYHKINFNTELANEYYKLIDTNLKRIRIKTIEISNLIKEYKEKIKKEPHKVNEYYKELSCYEKLYKMQSEALNDCQSIQIQLRMVIENEKQIKENELYEQVDKEKKIVDEKAQDIIKTVKSKMKSIN